MLYKARRMVCFQQLKAVTYLPKSANITRDPARDPAIYWRECLVSPWTNVETRSDGCSKRLNPRPAPDKASRVDTYQSAVVVSISDFCRDSVSDTNRGSPA